MADAPNLLTEAQWMERLAAWSVGESYHLIITELRERGLIADEPVDPLLIEAREMLVALHERGLDLYASTGNDSPRETFVAKYGAANDAIRAGKYDKHGRLLELLAALRRGLELARQSEETV